MLWRSPQIISIMMNCFVTLKRQRPSLREEVSIYSAHRYEETDRSHHLSDLLPPTSFSIPSSADFASNTFDLNSFPSILFPDPNIDTAGIADFSAPVPQNPASNLSWTFPSLIPQNSLGPLDELQNPMLNFFAQDSSFMFDPSIMGLYTSSLSGDSALPLSTAGDKAAKQRKLLEMQEAARRLEAEIAASSVSIFFYWCQALISVFR
jgi:hypothetical protein